MDQRSDRLDRIKEYVFQNGIIWSCLHIIFVLLRNLEIRTDRLKRFIEHKYTLPGTYYSAHNYRLWEGYDWMNLGEEWTPSDSWKQSLFSEVIKPHASNISHVLEIGCGGGRWSELLLNIGEHLILVDISPKAIEVCKSRFAKHNHIEYYVNNGATLDFIKDQSIDFIWSVDVFTVVGIHDTKSYIKEFGRVLKQGGTGIIQHSGPEGYKYGWSSLDSNMFLDLLSGYGLTVVNQFTSWGDNHKLEGIHTGTIMTVFTKE
jgi:ubiquinone/menaquinone biosynthesis C-methylase UbiE